MQLMINLSKLKFMACFEVISRVFTNHKSQRK